MKGAVAFVAGVLFAVGLGLGGMTDGNKVIGFLNLAAAWDPSLALVMGGAVAVHLPAVEWARRAGRPWFAEVFDQPATHIDPALIAGAALFGAGWGWSGFCPGPALVSLVTLNPSVWVFVGGMSAGMVAWSLLSRGSPAQASAT